MSSADSSRSRLAVISAAYVIKAADRPDKFELEFDVARLRRVRSAAD